MKYRNLVWCFLIIELFFTLKIFANAYENSATLVVNQIEFNYSDGDGSDEHRLYTRTQGLDLGQPHCTKERAGKATYYIFMFPKTESLKIKLRQNQEANEFMERTLGFKPTEIYMDAREAIKKGYYGRLMLSVGENIFPKLQPGAYFILPAIEFPNGLDVFKFGLWVPKYFDEEITTEIEVISFEARDWVKKKITLTPVLWCPKEINLLPNKTTTISIRPHPFNMTSGIDNFIQSVILGESE